MQQATPAQTTLTIGRRSFTVEKVGDNYRLTGKRGAVYGTMRNKPSPELMFIVNLRGFGMACGYEGIWLTDADGALRVRGAA